nr:RNA polymerase sigma factor [uncultured Cellulosilyticum sp.]
MTENKALIQAAQNGDLEAFERLISLYENNIYKLCLKMLQNEEEAADAFQEVCLKVWKQLKHYKGDAKLSTWIYRLTTNQCIDLLRKNKKHITHISIFQRNEKDEEWLIDEVSKEDVVGQVEAKALKEVIQIGLSELKPEYRAIIVLKDVEDYSYDEIAEILQISLGTVKSRLSRARGALKKVLEQNKEPYKSFFRQKGY